VRGATGKRIAESVDEKPGMQRESKQKILQRQNGRKVYIKLPSSQLEIIFSVQH